MRKLIAPLLGAICLLGAFGCAGSESTLLGDHNPRVRFANATGAGEIDAWIDDEKVADNLTYGSVSNEAIITNGNHTAKIQQADGTFINQTQATFELNANYTLVAYTRTGTGEQVLFNYRDNEDTTPGKGELRFIRATTAFGAVNVYVYREGTARPTNPTFTLTDVGQSTDVLALDPGTYRVEIIDAGNGTTYINRTVDVQSEVNMTYLFARNGAGEDSLISYQDNNPGP
jgi:hypothetical protein